jgi:hypothetical protein
MFGGGNYDADDIDEWLTLQRDWQVDAGIEPASEAAVLAVRERAGRAVQAVFAHLGLPPVTDAEIEAATLGRDSRDLPDRDRGADVLAADRMLEQGVTSAEVALGLDAAGFTDVAEAIVGMGRQRVSADYLQTSAIVDAAGRVHSAVNDPNRYHGPGTGYRLEGERWQRLQALPHVVDPATVGLEDAALAGPPLVLPTRVARPGSRPDEVVLAVGPAFGDVLRATLAGLGHDDVLDAVLAGLRDGGAHPRLVKVRDTSDVAFIGHRGARLAGSGVGIGLQSKGTTVIHRVDLQPLDNLELFGMAPLLTLESYRQIGRNAAGYALDHPVGPVPTTLDNFARAKLIVRTTLLHRRETEAIVEDAEPVELARA